MPCGPVGVGGQAAPDQTSEEAFSFANDNAFATSMNNFALLWTAPMRAAMVIASEAMSPDERR